MTEKRRAGTNNSCPSYRAGLSQLFVSGHFYKTDIILFKLDCSLRRTVDAGHNGVIIIPYTFSNLRHLPLQQVLSKLVQDSRNPPEPALIPSRGFLTPPGGQLVQTLVGHSASAVYGLSATSDGKCVVTGISSMYTGAFLCMSFYWWLIRCAELCPILLPLEYRNKFGPKP